MIDLSEKWNFNQRQLAQFEPERNGRILKFQTSTNEIEVFANDLWSPTGLELTDDKSSLLVCESSARRLIKIQTKSTESAKSGSKMILIDNLPGECSHVRRSKLKIETYWIVIPNSRTESRPTWFDHLTEYPTMRLLIVRFNWLIKFGIEKFGQMSSSLMFEQFGFETKNGQSC